MISLGYRGPCAAAFVLIACIDAGHEDVPRAEPGASMKAPTDGNNDATGAVSASPDEEPRTPTECERDIDFRDWLWTPSLPPITERPINPRNSATRVHRVRDRIVRVEVAHEYTHRQLFELSDAGVEAMYKIPDWPPLQLRKASRPAGSKDWPVVLLIYVEGHKLPYLGHPMDGELYFAEDDDPWHFYVYASKDRFREIYPMPFGDGVYHALEDELGPPDPYGKRTAQAKIDHNIRCGHPYPVPPEPPSPFPNIPRAVIEPAEPIAPSTRAP